MEPYHPAICLLRVSYGETMTNKFTLCMNDYILQHKTKIDSRFYVYVHRRMISNSVFYVGKGTSSRAWNFKNRSSYWNNITNKHGVVVEIVYDNLSEKEALELEKDLINGFSETGTSLCNLTSGGESPVVSDSTREKLSKSRKGRPLTVEHKNALSLSRQGKSREDMRGKNNIKCDASIHTFTKIDGTDTFIGTRLELCEKFKLDHYLLRGLFLKQQARKSSQGWKLLKETHGTNQTES